MSIAIPEEHTEFNTKYNCVNVVVDLPIVSASDIVQRELTLVINPQYYAPNYVNGYQYNTSPYAGLRFPNSQVKMCTPSATLVDGFTAPKNVSITAYLVNINKDGERFPPNTVTITLTHLNLLKGQSGVFNIRAVNEIVNSTIWSIGCWHFTPNGQVQHVKPNPSLVQKHINHSEVLQRS
jgi:hypothetical protein